MLLRPKELSLLRTLAIAAAGIALPFLWPGVFANLFSVMPSGGGMHHDAWPAALSLLNVGADSLIGGAYTVIASILAYIVYQNRRALPFDWVVLAFGLFIIACGFTHLMHVLTRFVPLMWLDGYVRGLTAVVSVATAAALPPLVPRVAQLLNAERQLAEHQSELIRTNAALRDAVARAELLAALGDALQSATTTQEVEQRALQRLAPALQASSMLVLAVDGTRVRSHVVWGEPPAAIAALLARPDLELDDAPALRRAVTSRRAVYLNGDGTADDALPDVHGFAYGLEPILTRQERVVGCVAAWRDKSVGTWTQGQRDLMRRAAATVGLALERADAVANTERQRDALATANANLQRSNAELEQFAYVASHDLQAPIRAVTSFADVIARRYGDRLDSRGAQYLRQIVDNGQHMKRLVDDLLAYSRVANGQEAARPVDANAVFDAVAARLHTDTPPTDARVTRGDLPRVRVDAQQLDQLLQNLVSNGLKYRRQDTAPAVHVSAVRDGPVWRFAVADNGIGIEEKYFERIFVIFQRLHGRADYEGTGIGLAVCKKIVERHGGRLWLDSTPGKGSTFYFTLPGSNDLA